MMQADPRRTDNKRDDNLDRGFEKEGRTLRSLLQVQPVKSEQENIRFLEWIAGLAEEERVALRLYRMLISVEFSILRRYLGKNPGVSDAEMTKWKAELQSCTVGYVGHKLKSSHVGARVGASIYLVCVEGNAALSHIKSECMETALDVISDRVADNLFHAQTCRFSILHNELRSKLSEVGWLEDQFGRVNPATEKAKDTEAQFLG